MIRRWVAQGIYRPLYYRLYGRFEHRKYWKFLEETQWRSLAENTEIQKDLLYRMLEYCVRKVPYYMRIARERNITIGRATVETDLRKFPVLTKDMIRKEYDDLVVDAGSRSYRYSSGGSTGEPIILTQDLDYKMKMLLQKELQLEWAGIRTGDRTVSLWGAHTGRRTGRLKHAVRDLLSATTVLDALAMDEDRMQQYVESMNRIRPRFILAYAQSLYDLARFIRRNGLKVHHPKAIMVSASKLYPESRELIETVFGCKVFDRYGTREVGDIACECSEHAGQHLSIFMHYAEILDRRLRPVKPGKPGEIYITLLTNFTMPLVRYRIGDTVIGSDRTCKCGRGLPVLKDVVGREVDNFYRPDGTVVPGGRINCILGYRDEETAIRQYQVLQHDPGHIEIRAVIDDATMFGLEKDTLEARLREALGSGCTITWTFVKRILPSSSGKYRQTVRLFGQKRKALYPASPTSRRKVN
jgi:phenylacetate-CoA ligase